MMLRSIRISLLLVFTALHFGCGGGDGLDRQPVSGSVSLDGAPLKEGQIQFFPAANSAEAIATGGSISNGKYTIPKAEGPIPGAYTVQITASGGEQAKPEGNDGMPGTGPKHDQELIPAKYNVQSTLKAEVKSGAENTFDFPLVSK